ncbi:hypothetical protein [Paenibacillus methanolicus]|uniref:Erythromycin esterase n=1 Tax=Paenibacillus methanolicus TaxID=582686 RepID=A0A5S5C169_9BACL|nr:erythromycin esterase [Paenibacillus methanolicus]
MNKKIVIAIAASMITLTLTSFMGNTNATSKAEASITIPCIWYLKWALTP